MISSARGLPLLILALVAVPAGGCSGEPRELAADEDPLAAAEVRAVLRRVADWQLAHPKHDPRDWTNATFYLGVLATYRVTDDPAYLDPLIELGERYEWRLLPRVRHADDHALAQTYLELARLGSEPRRFEPFRATIDQMMTSPPDWTKAHQEIDYWWCDALFMSPPALAMLARETGDDRYLDFMDRLWLETYRLLYDEEERLFHRDLRFREDSNHSFWSRGNGWVLAGLARTLDELPGGRVNRALYERVFREMSERVAGLQSPDGLWRSDLLDFASPVPGESSGSALLCFALAWGVNQGLLDREQFGPVVEAAWVALYRNVDLSGRLGWVQKPGAGPGGASSRDWDVYGSGALLLAAEQVLRLRTR